MMPSDEPLLVSPETSVVPGLGASKSRPATVVVGTVVVVVVVESGAVEVLDVDVAVDVVDEGAMVELDVVMLVDVLVEDVLDVVGGRLVEVDVTEVDVEEVV